MKTLTAALLAATMLTTSAYAWTAQTNGPGPQAIGQDGGSATAQSQHQGQKQSQVSKGGKGGAGGAGGQGGNATGGKARGGTSNVSVNNSASSGGGGSSGGGVFLSIPDGRGEAPCGGGIGLGGGGSSAGGGVGGTLWEFGDCKRMRESAALERLGYTDAAVAELCQIDRVREAFGGTCPSPRLALDTDAGKWDYCFTRNAGDLNQHRECDRLRAERAR